jgi:hypothetical protein
MTTICCGDSFHWVEKLKFVGHGFNGEPRYGAMITGVCGTLVQVGHFSKSAIRWIRQDGNNKMIWFKNGHPSYQ